MAPFEFTRTLEHPHVKLSPAHKHFAPTPFSHQPYSATASPSSGCWRTAPKRRSSELQLGFDDAAEAAVHEEMRFQSNWIQVKKTSW